jgi:hypothetical protein
LLGLTTVLLAFLLGVAAPVVAQTVTQSVPLLAGWNAVWLEVEPVYPDGNEKAGQAKSPGDVFSNPAIDIVATPRLRAGTAEFFASEPGSLASVTTFNQDEWQQWKRTDVTGTNNLSMVFGNRPYLVHTTGAANLSITGMVRFFRPTWNADRYNLLGFGLEGTRTFSQFFAAAGTSHPLDKIFTLTAGGNWVKVVSSQTMESGKAYWIFASGPSSYMGPVAVDFEHSVTGDLDFGGSTDAVTIGTDTPPMLLDLEELVFTNHGIIDAAPSASVVSVDSGLSLYRVTPDPVALGYVRGNGFPSGLPAVAAGQTTILTLGAMRTFSDDVVHTSLYRLKTGATGASFYLPVKAVRSDVKTPATASGGSVNPLAGLWVGEVVVNQASSIVVEGAPVQPTAGSAPLRIILHADAGGSVRLLSQVTLMQTKTADPSVPGTPVLVVDPARIPFFEGIKERNGKRVGLRIEAVAYDMPRRADAWSGEELSSFPIRPSNLQETYDFSVGMTGSLGGTLGTTLTLDPFHRSNPFRHAYHQSHSKGPDTDITRAMTLEFDPDPAVADRLSGTYRETITGLIKDELTLTGRFELRCVSPVATLEGAP